MNFLNKNLSRVLFAIPLFVFGLFHFMNGKQMADLMIPSWLPGGILWVYLTGLALMAAALSFVLNKKVKLAGQLLGLMLLLFILLLHVPGLMDESTMQMSMTNLLKDFGLMAGAFYISATVDS